MNPGSAFGGAASALSGGDPHVAAIGEGAATGATIGSAIPIPGVGQAIGAIVGAVIAAINSGSLSPEEAKARLDVLNAHPEAVVWMYGSWPGGHVTAHAHYHWLFGRVGLPDPGTVPADLSEYVDVVYPILKADADSAGDKGTTDVSVGRIGQESPQAAQKILAAWKHDPDILRDWVKTSTDEAKKSDASALLKRWAGWAWPQYITAAAGYPGLFSNMRWQVAFGSGNDAATIESAFRSWRPPPAEEFPWAWAIGAVALAGVAGWVGYRRHQGLPLLPKPRDVDAEIRHALGIDARTKKLNWLTADDLVRKESPADVYRRVLRRGLVDGELSFSRRGVKVLTPFHRAFDQFRDLGVSPTDLAADGRYFGGAVMPIRVDVQFDGTVHLTDGRRRYLAAKDMGAQAILAQVRRLDEDGEVVEEQTKVVKVV